MVNPRQTARICRIMDLVNGKYVVQEGWEPNYVDTNLGRISRANLMGVVVDRQDELNFVLDDGTSRMIVRSFEGGRAVKCEQGQLVMVIGRPRRFNDQLFLVPEIVKHITNKDWADYRKKELERLSRKEDRKQEPRAEDAQKIKPGKSQDDLVSLIEELDKGEGVQVESLIDKTGVEESKINRLLEEGVIFSNRPGCVKLL